MTCETFSPPLPRVFTPLARVARRENPPERLLFPGSARERRHPFPDGITRRRSPVRDVHRRVSTESNRRKQFTRKSAITHPSPSSSSSPARRIQSKSPPHLHVFVSLPVARHDVMALLFQSLGEVRADETARARDANFQFLFRPVRLRAVDASQFVSRGRHGSFGSLRARFGRRSRCVDGRRAAAEVRSLGSVRALFQSSRALFSIPVPVLPHTRTLCVCIYIHARLKITIDRAGRDHAAFLLRGTGRGRPRRFFRLCGTQYCLHTHHRARAGHPDRAGRFFTRLDSARGVPLAHDGGGASKKPTATGDTSRRGAGAGFTERTAIEGRRITRASDRSIDDESNRTERSFDPTRGKREEGNRTDKRTWRRHRARRWTTRDSARS